MRPLLVLLTALAGLFGLAFAAYAGLLLLGRADYVGAVVALVAAAFLLRASTLWAAALPDGAQP